MNPFSLADRAALVAGSSQGIGLAIATGLIKTPLNAARLELRGSDLPRHYEMKILLGRIVTPEDCAGAAVFLLSPAASRITGQIIAIDGGLAVAQAGKP